MFEFENQYKNQGYKIIAGMDEAGRGPLAGPVVCACVVMPLDDDKIIEGINDSKKLSEKKREQLYEKILQVAIDVSVSFVDERKIDEINILQATMRGMEECVSKLKQKPDILLVDAVKNLNVDCECLPIIKGDAKSYSIAAASIVAKVTRDKYMQDMHKLYPEYNFLQNKGYGTKVHIEALKKFGKCKIHRDTFIKNFIEG